MPLKLLQLALGAVLALCLGAAGAAGLDIRLEPLQVSPNVYYFRGESGAASAANKGYMSNAGFVVTSDRVVVYDALGSPALGQAMIDAIGRITSKPIRQVIVGHYHADHFYGLQAFRRIGARILAHANGKLYLQSDLAQQRLAQRRGELFPWVDDDTALVAADQWLVFDRSGEIVFRLGGTTFKIIDSSGAHSPEDLMLFVEQERVLFAGDLYFSGRIPFVGNADSKAWLAAMERMLDAHPHTVVPGHGAASTNTLADMQLTRRYLQYLRQTMGAAVQQMTGFEEAYRQTDWSAFAAYPAFEQANRLNAFGTYILMEQESLQSTQGENK